MKRQHLEETDKFFSCLVVADGQAFEEKKKKNLQQNVLVDIKDEHGIICVFPRNQGAAYIG